MGELETINFSVRWVLILPLNIFLCLDTFNDCDFLQWSEQSHSIDKGQISKQIINMLSTTCGMEEVCKAEWMADLSVSQFARSIQPENYYLLQALVGYSSSFGVTDIENELLVSRKKRLPSAGDLIIIHISLIHLIPSHSTWLPCTYTYLPQHSRLLTAWRSGWCCRIWNVSHMLCNHQFHLLLIFFVYK